MWTAIYIAQDNESVENITGLLGTAGIIYKIKPVSNTAEKNCCEVLVPSAELNQAVELVIDMQI